MDWTTGVIVFVFIFLVVIAVSSLFLFARRRDKNLALGTEMFKDVKIPEIYVADQRYFRYSYAIFKTIHFLLVVISITASSITVYLVAYSNAIDGTLIAFSVVALITTTVNASVSPDKIATAYGKAFRKLEQGIIEYACETGQYNTKHKKSSTKTVVKVSLCKKSKAHMILAEANKDAQRTIEELYG